MEILIAGLLIFLGTHSISIVNAPWRDRVAVRLGEPRWQAIFGIVSIAGFALVIWGYGLARRDPLILYVAPVWLRHLALLLMVPVFPLLLAAYLPGHIKSITEHPMLAAVVLWAFAHLLANGALADLVLFGSFLVWAIADLVSMKARVQRPIPGAPRSRWNDWIATGAGLALYFAFVLRLHLWLIGVPPVG